MLVLKPPDTRSAGTCLCARQHAPLHTRPSRHRTPAPGLLLPHACSGARRGLTSLNAHHGYLRVPLVPLYRWSATLGAISHCGSSLLCPCWACCSADAAGLDQYSAVLSHFPPLVSSIIIPLLHPYHGRPCLAHCSLLIGGWLPVTMMTMHIIRCPQFPFLSFIRLFTLHYILH
ncbi:hypothetical protein BKA93DRAFT_303947 [Sparassis latifolia]